MTRAGPSFRGTSTSISPVATSTPNKTAILADGTPSSGTDSSAINQNRPSKKAAAVGNRSAGNRMTPSMWVSSGSVVEPISPDVVVEVSAAPSSPEQATRTATDANITQRIVRTQRETSITPTQFASDTKPGPGSSKRGVLM
jgi:hypothetical protein